jgi:hypothetical protein
LSFCAIPIGTAVEAAELQSPTQDVALFTEQQSSSKNFTDFPDGNNNEVLEKLDPEAVLEEINLEKEWESILGDDFEQELLADRGF